jgi:Flp pilus assembly protein CpaB
LKRSNRLVLLIGVLLAVVAFGGVFFLLNQPKPPTTTAPTELPTVYARQNIPLGTVITAEMVEARNQQIAVRDTNAFGDIGQVVGKTVRAEVKQGQIVLPSDFLAGAGGGSQDVAHLLDPGLRAMAVQVDQSTGVGTLINVGDRVDLVVGFSGADKFPQLTVDPLTKSLTTVAGLSNTTTKLVLQNMQVIGTLVPPAAATTTNGASGSSGTSGSTAATNTALTGQQELVILAVTAQQAEVIKYAQIDGLITLVLRSPKDFVDANGNPVPAPSNTPTTGIILKTLIKEYGVLPPEAIQAQNLPSAAP